MINTQFSKPWHWLSLPIDRPFEIVAADIIGSLTPTARGHTHILVLVDRHTRWVQLIALPGATAELVAEAICEPWMPYWGKIRALLTNNRGQFTSYLLQQLTTVSGIKRIRSSRYSLRGNCVVESYRRTLKRTLKLCMQGFQTDSDVALQAAALACWATSHTVAGIHTAFACDRQRSYFPTVSRAA